MEDIRLTLLKENDVTKWTERAKEHLPISKSMFNYLSIGLGKKTINLSYIQFYVPSEESLPFFMIVKNVTGKKLQSMLPFWDPEEFEEETVVQLLKSLPEWDWTNNMYIDLASVPVLRQLEKLILKPDGLGMKNVILNPTSKINEGHSYKMTEVDQTKYRYSREHYVLDFIPPNYAEFMFSHWRYKDSSDLSLLQDYFQTLPPIGAFLKQPEGVDHKSFSPVSWAVSKHDGEIGMTTTLPEHRRKGLAGAVTLRLSEELLRRDITPRVVIVSSNPESIRIHKNLGFIQEDGVTIGYHIYDTI